MDYTTLAALRKFGNLGSTLDDVFLEATIGAASLAIENFTGRRFRADAESTRTFTKRSGYSGALDPFDGPLLLLGDDLAAVPSAITGSPAVTYLPRSAPYWGILLDEGNWSSPISVTGYWAYAKTPPSDIEWCCLRLAKWLYELRQAARGDAVVVTDQGAVLLPASLPADVQTILTPYRRPRLSA